MGVMGGALGMLFGRKKKKKELEVMQPEAKAATAADTTPEPPSATEATSEGMVIGWNEAIKRRRRAAAGANVFKNIATLGSAAQRNVARVKGGTTLIGS